GIGLRAMGQRDPLVEYQREGYQLFQAMNEAIKEESVSYLFHLEVKTQQPGEAPGQGGVTADAAAQTAASARLGATAGNGAAGDGAAAAARAAPAPADASAAAGSPTPETAGAQPSGRRVGARSVTANRSTGAPLAAAARDTAPRAGDGAPASAFGGGPQIVGLEEPQRPTALTYS